MSKSELSPQAMETINAYMHLPLDIDADVSVPYYNNRRQSVRAALRVLVGKGSVTDIVQEVKLIALREKIDISMLSSEQIKKFLVEHNIGIDCSGLVYHILDAETKAQFKKSITKFLRFPYARGVRKLLTKLRPAENTNVKSLMHESNSKEIDVHDVQAGDALFIMQAGPQHDRDHIILFHKVETDAKNRVSKIFYTHTFQWSQDGKYNHGVRQGTIEIIDNTKLITEQTWTEQSMKGNKNGTYEHVVSAKKLSLRRFNCFS